MSSCCCHAAGVVCSCRALTTPGAQCARLTLLTGVRLPAGGCTLVLHSALRLPARPVVVTLWPRAALTRHLAGRALHVWQRPLVAALPAVWSLLPAAVCCLTNSQGRDPRTPEVLRWAAPCLGAAPNSQGWGPQDPKRPVGPPFSGTLSLLSPTGYVPLFCFRPPPPCPWAAAVLEVLAPDQSKAPAPWPVSAGNGGYLAQRCPYYTRCLATTGLGARHKPRLLVSFSCRPAELPRGLLPSGSSPLGRGPCWPPASFPCRPITY